MKKTFVFSFAFMLVVLACTKPVISKLNKPNFSFKTQAAADVAASVAGENISEAELITGIETELFEAEMKVFDLKYARLQAILLEKFMNKDPNKKNLSNDEYLAKYIAKDVKVSEAEIEKFIKERQIPKEQINADIKERIKQFIEMEKKKVAVDTWLSKQTEKNPVEVYFSKPKRPTFNVTVGDAPFKGAEDAKVTIVEFSDFQCPFCSKGANLVSELEKKYGKKVKIVFKNFPLPFHAQAKIAAEAALCAKDQDAKAFWKLHDVMFQDQSKLDRDNLISSAKKIGLKDKVFTECLDGGKFKAKVEADMNEGQAIGVKSTPTFFVNGQLIAGAQPIEVFSEIIDEELAK